MERSADSTPASSTSRPRASTCTWPWPWSSTRRPFRRLLLRADEGARSPAGSPSPRSSGAAWWRCRSASATRSGWTTADFDIDYHVRPAAVPRPGGLRELAELAGDIASRQLDRSRAAVGDVDRRRSGRAVASAWSPRCTTRPSTASRVPSCLVGALRPRARAAAPEDGRCRPRCRSDRPGPLVGFELMSPGRWWPGPCGRSRSPATC